MRVSQLLALLVLFMLSLVIAVIGGALISFDLGTTAAASIVVVGTGLFTLLIERFVLGILRAKSLGSQSTMISRVRNLAIKVGVDHLDIYETEIFGHNIYGFVGLSKKPILVVGKGLEKALSSAEVDALILTSLYKIKTGEARFQTLSVAFSILFYLPFLLIRGRGAVKSLLGGIIMYYHSPFELLRLWLVRNDLFLMKLDQEVADRYDVREELASAYFKVAHLPRSKAKKFSEKIIESFSVADTSGVDGASKLFSFGVSMEDRYRALRKA